MNARLPDMQTEKADQLDAAPERATRYLPAPQTAAELAAIEAALHGPAHSDRITRTRVLVGSAVIALAVTLPDLSLGAMGSPYNPLSLGEPVTNPPAGVWAPAARPVGPVYAPIMAAQELAPEALAFSGTRNANPFDRLIPLDFLDSGSERFDLAFAGVPMPSPAPIQLPMDRPTSLSPRPARQPLVAPRVVMSGAAPLAYLVEAPQVMVVRGPRPASVPGLRPATSALTENSAADRSIAATNESLEAAFAGVIDVSGAVRTAIPVAQPRQPNRPEPVRDPVVRAVSLPAPNPALTASAAAQTELVPKTRLDARVNGVLTGSVDFRQLDGTIAIRLGSVLDMLRDRFTAAEFAQLSAGQSGNAYVTLAQLQSAGIPINYNPAYDEVEFGIDYDDAPQAGKVQVEQIGAPTVGANRAVIDQISR